MDPSHGLPAPSPVNKSGDDWLLPPFQGYGKTSDRVAWEEVRADLRDRIYFSPNRFRVRIRDSNGAVVASANVVNGNRTFAGLVRGEYTVEVTETDSVEQRYDLWAGKSGGRLVAPNRYAVVVTPGTQARITRIWEPQPVLVTLRVKTGDAAIHWEPRWLQESARNPDRIHNRGMLIPFPDGRVAIPGVTSAEYAACSDGAKNTLVRICDDDWAKLKDGVTTVQLKLRPGLYRSYWYQSFKSDTWHFKRRGLAKSDLGFGGASRWNSTFSMHGRVGYVYVNVDGTLSTANSSWQAGNAPQSNADSNVAIRMPGCSSRRDLLTDLFAEVPMDSLEDGTKRWIYHRPSDGRVMPDSLWQQLSPGMKTRLQSYTGDAALGWVKRTDRRGNGGEPYSVYRAANGSWNDAKTEIGWKYRPVIDMVWSGWYDEPGSSWAVGKDYNVEYRTVDRWVWNAKKSKWVLVKVRQYRYKYPVYGAWQPTPNTQWNVRPDWFIEEPVRRHRFDLIPSRTVYKMRNVDYREPLNQNVLYRSLSGVGVTEFTLYDRCTSSDKELDADKEELT
jgi:hypothetical protein